MKATFKTTFNLRGKPDLGICGLAEIPKVKTWGELTPDQLKEYARIWVYEMSSSDVADRLYNAGDTNITLEE